MNLPEDITVEILSKLPVKSLIRFKCVSKLWYSLINNQNFISKHINNQNKKTNNASLLISHRNNVTNNRVVSLLADGHKIDTFHDQDLPPIFHDMFGHIRFVGPCHGLVCLYGFPDNIAIWNPSTREFKAVPQSPIPRPPDAKVRGGDLGLGFDSNTNDYKVIQILFCLSSQLHGFVYQMEIYSLLTNSWKKYDSTFPANIMYINIWSMVYKNETFCWWAKDGNIEVILSFDMSKEVFRNTPLPLDIEMLGGQHRIIRAILPLHDESIALVVYRLKEVEKCFDIWVMNGLEANNGHQSWRKMSTIGPLSRVERPLGFSKNGEFILESSSRELVFYDPRKQEIKNLGMYGKRDRLEVLNYKESLVSVNRCNIR